MTNHGAATAAVPTATPDDPHLERGAGAPLHRAGKAKRTLTGNTLEAVLDRFRCHGDAGISPSARECEAGLERK